MVVAEVEVEVFVVAVAAAVAATAGFLADGEVKGERAQGDSHRRCSLPVVRSPFFVLFPPSNVSISQSSHLCFLRPTPHTPHTASSPPALPVFVVVNTLAKRSLV